MLHLTALTGTPVMTASVADICLRYDRRHPSRVRCGVRPASRIPGLHADFPISTAPETSVEPPSTRTRSTQSTSMGRHRTVDHGNETTRHSRCRKLLNLRRWAPKFRRILWHNCCREISCSHRNKESIMDSPLCAISVTTRRTRVPDTYYLPLWRRTRHG